MKTVNCPYCGEPLLKGSEGRHYCENESCPVIFVQYPNRPAKRRVVHTSLATKKQLKKIEEVKVKKRAMYL